MLDFKNYLGREQAYAKHFLLREYLRALIHKTASRWNHIVYVDGFAGPWQTQTEDCQDTSFGIALHLLTEAKATWATQSRTVTMTALLVEKDREAYKRLATIASHFPDVNVKTYQGDFVERLPAILNDIPARAFTFFLIDPKGWKIPLLQLKPLLRLDDSEVLFNFMFDFINRFAEHEDPAIAASLNELMPNGDWRGKLLTARKPHDRFQILVDAFSENLKDVGKYQFICETPIRRPDTDRILYSLVYGTRHKMGLEVFRDCQVKVLREQAKTREQTKLAKTAKTSGQGELFGAAHEMAPDHEAQPFLEEQQNKARDLLLSLVPVAPQKIRFDRLWPQILQQAVIRRPELHEIAYELKKTGRLQSPNWVPRQRVPHDDTLMQRPDNAPFS